MLTQIEQDLLRRSIDGRRWFVALLSRPDLDLSCDQDFCAIIRHAFTRFGLDHKSASFDLKVSQSTISRWQSGCTTPIMASRTRVVEWIIATISKSIDLEESRLGDSNLA